MQRYSFSLLFLAIFASLYPAQTLANLNNQCLKGVPHFAGKVVKGDPNAQPVFIEANKASLSQNNNATYEGNVQIRQGNRYLSGKKATVKQWGNKNNPQREVEVSGGFDYQDNLIYLLGDRVKVNLGEESAEIQHGIYQLVDKLGRGDAKSISLQPDYRLLKDATFTTCVPTDDSWSIKADEMKQYIKEEYAEMWHARFQVQGVPIFYTPYLQMPIGDRRRSGLLLPEVSTGGRDGFSLSVPVYWNIAPNMDATFTPKYMSRRGWQAIGEYRILTPFGQSTLAGEYLHRDRLHDLVNKDHSRHLFYWEHHANLANNWRLHIDYTKVSDPTYLDDFDSLYGHSTDGYADQRIELSYYQPNYNFKLSALQFQLFDPNLHSPYRTIPKAEFNYYKDEIGGLVDFHLFTEAAHFRNEDKNLPSAWRLHMEPSLRLPLSNRFGGITFESKLYATHYWQEQGAGKKPYHVEKSVTRVLPEFKVTLNTLLAKDYANGYTQTIEPSVNYTYRPYKNQSNIGVKNSFGYDSSSDFNGIDRILSANEITTGATTRFYDETGIERLNLGLEQTYYLDDAKAESRYIKEKAGSADWRLNANYFVNPAVNFSAEYKYNAEYHRAGSANATVQYRPTTNHLIQLGYRYINKKELISYDHDIKQLGLTFAWSFMENWSVVSKHYYDFAIKRPVDQFIGVQYDTCCWGIALGVNRYVETRANQQKGEVLFDHSIGFRFELRGFGNSPSRGTEKMLDEGKLPYIQPFNL